MGAAIRRAFLAALVLILAAAGARAVGLYSGADAVVRNFDGLGTARDNQIVKVDTNGDRVRSDNEGPIVQWPGDKLFYMYGVDNSPPTLYQTSAPFGGFTVYTSPDLIQWTPAGSVDGVHMTDPSNTTWQNTCRLGVYVTQSVCWLPRPVFSPGLGNYVLWFNNSNQNFAVVCTTKTGGCAAPGAASACQVASHMSQNGNPFIDPDTGTGYIVFSVNFGAGNFDTYIQQLNANYTDCVGSPVVVSANSGEVPAMFKRGTTFYIVVSNPLCPFCTGVPSYYYTSASPLVSWAGPTQFDTSNTCGGQGNVVNHLTIGGNDVYLYTGFLWDPGIGGPPGEGSQTLSNQFWVPLTFTGTAINTFSCPASVTFSGLSPVDPPSLSATDQTDENAPANSACDINSGKQRAQLFTPSRSGTLSQVWIRTGNGNATCRYTGCANSNGVNADLTVSIKATLAGVPTGADLATMTVSRVGETWGVRRHKLTSPAVSLTGGTQYAIVLASTASVGCWTTQYSNISGYAGGNALFSTNGGSTWTPQAGVDLIFSTVLQ